MRLLWLSAAAAASAELLCAQSAPTIRSETRVVQIDVEARDAHGRPIAGLAKDDFLVLDSGKPRAIQIFSVEGEAGALPSPPALPANVFSNHAPAARPRHSTVILIDGINNYWDDFAAARQRLMTMFDNLRREERIAIYVARSQPAGISLIQDFTTDRARLRKSIEGWRPPPIDPAPGMGPPRPISLMEQEAIRRRAIYDTMDIFRLLSAHLGKLPGRKSLLWLTSGLPPKQLQEMPAPFDRAANALNEANIAVDTIDDDGVGDPKRRWGSRARETLRDLSDRTGGRAIIGRNDLENMVQEAIETPRVLYTLGFYVPENERDGKYHPLVVKVNRPKVTLSHRQGYFASESAIITRKTREPLENALLDAQDSSEIELSAEATRGPYNKLRLAMRVRLPNLTLREQGSRWSGKVEELFVETNASGRVVAKIHDTKEFRVSERMRARFDTEGLPLDQEITLAEDAARVLIVVRDGASGRTGSLSVPLADLP